MRYSVATSLLVMLSLTLMLSEIKAETAESVLRDAVQNYHSMKTYTDAFVQNVLISGADKSNTMNMDFNLTLAQPNKIALNLTSEKSKVSILSDGKTLVTYLNERKRYSKEKSPASMKELIPSLLFRPNIDRGKGIVLLAFFQKNPYEYFTSGAESVEYAGLETKDSVSTHRINIQRKDAALRLWIDAERSVLVRSEIEINRKMQRPGGPQAQPGNMKVVIEEIHSLIKVDQTTAPDAFIFKPDEGAEEVADLFAPPPDVSGLEGKPAPNFKLPSLKNNETLELSKFKGKVVMLDFWATWCGPCRQELPKLQEIKTTFKDKEFIFIAVNSREPKDKVQKFIDDGKYDFTVALDGDGRVTQEYGVRSFPTLIILDKTGTIVKVHQGYRPGMEKSVAEEIKKLLEN